MTKIYSTAKVPSYQDSSVMLPLDPNITKIMEVSRYISYDEFWFFNANIKKLPKLSDPKELEHYWNGWRDATGKKMRPMFAE